MPGNYAGATGNGARLPVYNRRLTPLEVGQYVVCADTLQIDIHPQDSNLGVVRLYERPLADYGGSGLIVRDANTNATFNASLTFPPGTGTFYLNPYQGRLFFNKNDVGRSVRVNYTGTGSIVDAEDVNWCYTTAQAAARPFSGQFTVSAGMSHRVEKRVFAAVYEVLLNGDLQLNPPDVEVRVESPEDAEYYASVLKNNGEVPRTFRVKYFELLKPEK